MENTVVIDFKNIVSELESKKLKLCYFRNGHFVEDTQGNLYAIEILYHGSYLDKLIKDGNVVEFTLIDDSVVGTVKDYEKKVWEVSEVNEFIKRHSL